jgi:hypothetical protein
MKRRILGVLAAAGIMGLLGTATAAAPSVAPAASEPQSAVGTFDLQVTFGLVSNPFTCPADVLPPDVPPAATECRARTSTASVRGLGTVSLTYTWPLGVGPPTCPTDFAKPLAATGRLSVAGKGEITFTLAEGARCVLLDALPQNEPQELTITGGTGRFAAAFGRGTVAGRSTAGALEARRGPARSMSLVSSST